MPSAGQRALGKEFKKNSNFAECRQEGTWQRFFLKKNQTLPSAGKRALGKEFFLKKKLNLCRVPMRGHSPKNLKKIQTLPSAGNRALGKEF